MFQESFSEAELDCMSCILFTGAHSNRGIMAERVERADGIDRSLTGRKSEVKSSFIRTETSCG